MTKNEPFRDPRLFQILALSSLLLYGVTILDLRITPPVAAAILSGALGTQALACRVLRLPFEAKSALISSLSLCLLLRTSEPWLGLVVAMLAIGSKFVVRARGKHIFNPTNFGLTAGLLLLDGVWVSPGQWGSVAFFGFLLACAGTLVVHRSRRSDVTWAFLFAWSALLIGRALWLGDPMDIPRHQLQNGAVLIFAFFMISDPKTTPDHRLGRILWAFAIAGLAAFIQFSLYHPNALLWALVLSAPLVPLLDRWIPAERFAWDASPRPLPKEIRHEPSTPPSAARIHTLRRVARPPGIGLLRLLRRQGRDRALQPGLEGRGGP